jgi:Domain of unknown function (DUF4260)
MKTGLKNTIKLEEAAMLAGSIYFLYTMDVAWWWYVILLLGPDISMLGYLAGNKTGAVCYNFFHHKAVAVIVLLTGITMPDRLVLIIGLALFGHSSMDRMFGYGLKTFEGFKFTHLGTIGK